MPLTTTATSWTLHISTWITGLLGELHMINFFLNWCGCDYIDLLNGSRLPCYMTIMIHFFHATWQWLRLKVPGGHLNIKILWFWTGPIYYGIVYHTAHTKIGLIDQIFNTHIDELLQTDVTTLLTHWSYIFLALTNRYISHTGALWGAYCGISERNGHIIMMLDWTTSNLLTLEGFCQISFCYGAAPYSYNMHCKAYNINPFMHGDAYISLGNEWVFFGSGNGFSPVQWEAVTRTFANLSSIGIL